MPAELPPGSLMAALKNARYKVSCDLIPDPTWHNQKIIILVAPCDFAHISDKKSEINWEA